MGQGHQGNQQDPGVRGRHRTIRRDEIKQVFHNAKADKRYKEYEQNCSILNYNSGNWSSDRFGGEFKVGGVTLLSVFLHLCVILGFLWVHHLQVVHVLQRVQQFLAVQPRPSPHVPLWDPVSRIGYIMAATGHMTNSMMAPPVGGLDQVIIHSPSFQAPLQFQVVQAHQALPVEQFFLALGTWNDLFFTEILLNLLNY